MILPVPGPRAKSSFSGDLPNYYKEGKVVVNVEMEAVQVCHFSI